MIRCDLEHFWSGWRCQAEAGHDGPHRYNVNGWWAEWTEARSVMVLNRQGQS